jgi:hypothetical protein
MFFESFGGSFFGNALLCREKSGQTLFRGFMNLSGDGIRILIKPEQLATVHDASDAKRPRHDQSNHQVSWTF